MKNIKKYAGVFALLFASAFCYAQDGDSASTGNQPMMNNSMMDSQGNMMKPKDCPKANCPKADGTCPKADCPKADGKCPMSDCPKAKGKCPKSSCPKADGTCPKMDKKCPMNDSANCSKSDGKCQAMGDKANMGSCSDKSKKCPKKMKNSSKKAGQQRDDIS